MKKLLTQTLLAAAIGGAALTAAPANAASFSIGFGFPGVGFSYNSGGYCDRWGCPDQFWDYPIYYCPVYYRGTWFSGPVYYRSSRNGYLYWVHGGWRRDTWNRQRPRGACVDRYGPPLDLDFYIWNGFSVRDQWRYSWRNNRNDWWNHRQDWDRSNRSSTNWQSWVPTQQRNYDWNRQRDWNGTRDWTKPDWNRSDWERRNNIQRGAGASTPTTPYSGVNPMMNRSGPSTPAPQMTPTLTPPAGNNSPADMGGRNRDQFKGGKDNKGAATTQGGTVAPPVQTTPVFTGPATNNPPADLGGHKDRGLKNGKDNQGMVGTQGGSVAPPVQTAPTVTPPPASNLPADTTGRGARDRHRGGKDNQGTVGTQGGTATPPVQAAPVVAPPVQVAPVVTPPVTTTPPADKKKDHKKNKDGQDNAGTDQNTPQ